MTPPSLYSALTATPLEASSGILNIFYLRKFENLCNVQISTKRENICKIFDFCYFSWEVGGTLSQNSYKPSRNLWEATLLRRTWSVQLFRYKYTHRQTDRHPVTLVYGFLVDSFFSHYGFETNQYPVLSHTEKSCNASYYIHYSTNIKMHNLYPRKAVYKTIR